MGGETSITAKKAEIIGKNIFEEFRWESIGPFNHNWTCEDEKLHNVKTHPTDAVYYYDEPYSKTRTYINIDFKSYAAPSIKSGEIKASLHSLSNSITCAEQSKEWQGQHVHSENNFEICGLLFVYNHTGDYDDSKFHDALETVKVEKLGIPSRSKIVVLGPSQINWLNNVQLDIKRARGATPPELPSRDKCKYLYPNLIMKKNIQQEKAVAATLEMLTGPWLIVNFDDQNGSQGIVIYYNRPGNKEEEFVHLLDYLMYFQLVNRKTKIFIKTYKADKLAPVVFQKAKQRYVDAFGSAELQVLLNAIDFSTMINMQTSFSDVELGMK